MARTDFEPLTWEEAEQNRLDNLQSALGPRSRPEVEFPGVFPEIAALLAETPYGPGNSDRSGRTRCETRLERCDRLRSELKRGREYLEQAQKNLAESRDWLEDWPAYEQVCGKNPLARLTQSVLLNARIARFLAGWMKRREAELEALTRSGRA